jgi:RNA exonuclease 1
LVKPNNKITNYLTQYSGITASKLKDVTTTLSDVQEVIIKLLPPDAILVGQSLNCDLEALKVNNVFYLK